MTQPPEQAPVGVIHNIGYRGYSGPRLGRQAVTRALFTHSLRGIFGLGRSGRSKVLPMGMFAIMCLPALVLAVVTVVGSNQGVITRPPLAYTSYAMVTQAVIAIFLAAQAPQAVSLDVRYATLPLYFSRPLERTDYVAAKYAALSTALFILLSVPIVIMYTGTLLAELPVAEYSSDALAALAGAVVYALVLAGLGLLIASVTARRGFGVAAIITVLALSYTLTSAMQGLFGHGQDNMTAAGWLGLLSPMTLVDGVQVWAFDAQSSTITGPPGTTGGIVFCLVTLAVIAGSYRLLLARYRRVRL
ncbi:ABC transporter permease [Phytoactinopolyspora limicola]|uniref:ABC transporter permease n=1 Tax=Phytoactinopolyspora limicola TaxID=2715536 RepID=UPI00140B6E5F|nr:ABC transporter permease [Phytoactinopolyspora limicola]